MEGTTATKDQWRFVVMLSKFIFLFLEVAITKSFGVLIPTMMYVFSTDASSLGFVCSLPASMMYVTSLPVAYLLKTGRISPRKMAVIGTVISSLGIIITGRVTSLIAFGFYLALIGVGLSMGYIPSTVSLNDYFQDEYLLMNAISNLGGTTGSLVVPVIIERALQAYGLSGAMLIMGGISLHAIVASATLRTRESSRRYTMTNREENIRPEEIEERHLINNDESDDIAIDNSETLRPVDKFYVSPKCSKDHKRESRTKWATMDESILSTKDSLRNCIRHCIFMEEPLLLLALICEFLMSFVTQSWTLFLVPRAMSCGVPSSEAVLLSSICGGAGIIGRLICIPLIYFGADFIFIYLVLNVVLSTTFLMDPLLTSFSAMCVSAFIQGFCVFSSGLAASAFLKNAVSDKNITVAVGIFGFTFGIGGNVGGLLSGMIKDRTGSYTTVFIALGFVNCVTVLITIAFMIARRRLSATRL